MDIKLTFTGLMKNQHVYNMITLPTGFLTVTSVCACVCVFPSPVSTQLIHSQHKRAKSFVLPKSCVRVPASRSSSATILKQSFMSSPRSSARVQQGSVDADCPRRDSAGVSFQ